MVRREGGRERLEPQRSRSSHPLPLAGAVRESGHELAATIPPANSDLAQQATRDPYLFDFLGTADLRHERDLEQTLIEHVSSFLLELGQGFAYVGRQVRLEIGDQDFYCDLLFYHLRLRAYAAQVTSTWRVAPH